MRQFIRVVAIRTVPFASTKQRPRRSSVSVGRSIKDYFPMFTVDRYSSIDQKYKYNHFSASFLFFKGRLIKKTFIDWLDNLVPSKDGVRFTISIA